MRTLFTFILVLLISAPFQASAQVASGDPGAAGWQALQENDGTAASRLFALALGARPKDAVLHLGAGAAAHMIGRDDDAMRALTLALTHDPTLAVASRLLAEIAWQRGDLSLAIETYQQALTYAPDNTEMASRLARLEAESARRASTTQLRVAVSGPREEALAARANRVLSVAYWQVAKLVGAYPAEIITIYLDTSTSFEAQPPTVTAATVALAAPDANSEVRPIRLPAAGALADPERFDRVLTHTLVDAMVRHMAPSGVPAWFPRGLAQVVATADAAQARRRLRALGEIPWARLDNGGPRPADQADEDASLLVVRALLARIGSKSTQLLDELADGQSLDAALSQFGFSWADLKADVVQSLDQ